MMRIPVASEAPRDIQRKRAFPAILTLALALALFLSPLVNTHTARGLGDNGRLAGTGQALTVSTPLASPARLHITVDLQGRPLAPDPSWQTALQVTISAEGSPIWSGTISCDPLGALEIEGLEAQAYTVSIKGLNTLTNVRQTQPLEPGLNLLHMGTLLAGDTTGDDQIDILDFSLFRTLFGTSDSRADLNNSGHVDILDFSLLRSNFGKRGPINLGVLP